jgi:hypothetical protein
MTKASSGGRPAGSRAARKEARAARLAAALKSNLRRRKVQARSRAAEGEPAQADADAAAPHDGAAIAGNTRTS